MSESYPGCEIYQVLPENPEELKVIENDFWVATVRENDQTLLGTCFITPKRHVYELDQLITTEDEAFVVVRNALIRAVRGSFDPITFNISCLKNNTFLSHPDTTPSEAAHVHWHVKPRYGTSPIAFAGHKFTDPAPGRYLDRYPHQPVSREVAAAIARTLRRNLPQE
jgi:diadenosine tetraphosphate (Ap4A) HIT family hydrolase